MENNLDIQMASSTQTQSLQGFAQSIMGPWCNRCGVANIEFRMMWPEPTATENVESYTHSTKQITIYRSRMVVSGAAT